MKENEDKYLDSFTKKIVKTASLERPSIHFTSEIMAQVNVLSTSKAVTYKPLISKKSWIIITLGFTGLCMYLIFGTETQQSSWFANLNFSVLSDSKFTNVISGFKVSKTMMYAITFLGLMLCVQIPFLKKHFDKRFEV